MRRRPSTAHAEKNPRMLNACYAKATIQLTTKAIWFIYYILHIIYDILYYMYYILYDLRKNFFPTLWRKMVAPEPQL